MNFVGAMGHGGLVDNNYKMFSWFEPNSQHYPYDGKDFYKSLVVFISIPHAKETITVTTYVVSDNMMFDAVGTYCTHFSALVYYCTQSAPGSILVI